MGSVDAVERYCVGGVVIVAVASKLSKALDFSLYPGAISCGGSRRQHTTHEGKHHEELQTSFNTRKKHDIENKKNCALALRLVAVTGAIVAIHDPAMDATPCSMSAAIRKYHAIFCSSTSTGEDLQAISVWKARQMAFYRESQKSLAEM